MNKGFIMKKLKQIIRKCETTNLYDIAENLNIIVHEDVIGNVYGFYIYSQKRKIIIINTNLSYSHKLIVLAHEIGHAVLHGKVNCAFMKQNTFMKNTYEQEANFFAYNMLKENGYFNDTSTNVLENEISDLDKGFLDIYSMLKNSL